MEAIAEAREQLVTHDYALTETIALVDRRLGRALVRRLVEDLVPLAEIEWVTPELHSAALASFLAAPSSSSFVDQVSFLVMRQRGLRTAFTFDRDFAGHGFEIVPR